MWSRETGSVIPSRVSLLILHTVNLVLTHGIHSAFHDGAHLYIYRQPPSGQSRGYQVTQLRTDGFHCREPAGTRPVVLKLVPVTPLYVSTMDQFYSRSCCIPRGHASSRLVPSVVLYSILLCSIPISVQDSAHVRSVYCSVCRVFVSFYWYYRRATTVLLLYCSMYVWLSHIARVKTTRVRLPILLVVSWRGKMNISLSPFAPENLVSQDSFGSPVPRQPAHLHTQAESGAYLRDFSLFPRRRKLIYLNRQTTSGQSRVYRVTQLRTDGAHCRESAGTGPVVLKVVPVTPLYESTMGQFYSHSCFTPRGHASCPLVSPLWWYCILYSLLLCNITISVQNNAHVRRVYCSVCRVFVTFY